jgi:hypothetical protein
MLFLRGKDQVYERLMQQTPYTRRSTGSGRRTIRYVFADLGCRNCLEEQDCQGECLCPYIFGNLPDLLLDPDFLLAVKTAESCKTPHKETLLYLLRNQEI